MNLLPEVWDRALYPDRPCYGFQMRAWKAIETAVMGALFFGDLWELLFKWPRQAGKNEVDSRLAAWLMVVAHFLIDLLPQRLAVLQAIKTAPTYKPGISVSKRRLELSLDHIQKEFGLGRRGWDTSEGYVYWFRAFRRALYAFVSASERAQKRGETANLFLSVDESQSTSLEVYSSELAAFRSTTSSPVAFWGTGGVEGCLIEAKQDELQALEDHDGKKRVHIVQWEEVAECNPRYGTFVERERDRMGADHIIYLSEYGMKRIPSGGDFVTERQLERMFSGPHFRADAPKTRKVRVGGLDFCGADELPDEAALDPDHAEEHDNTCGLVAELAWGKYLNELGETDYLLVVQVVAMLLIPGKPHDVLCNRLEKWFFETWRCSMIAVDANGVGDSPSKTLELRRGKQQVLRVHPNVENNSRMGYALQGLIKSGRLRWFRSDGPDLELEEARKQFRYLETFTTKEKKLKWGHPTKKKLVSYRSPSGIIVTSKNESIHDDIPKAAGFLTEAATKWMLPRKPAVKRDFVPFDEAAGTAG